MKRFRFLATLAIFAGAVWLLLKGSAEELPDENHPLLLYCNQSRQNLQKVFAEAIEETKKNVHLEMYAVTEPHLVDLLTRKTLQGIKTEVRYDPGATPDLSLPGATPANLGQGLMHRKILVTDSERVFVGSANFTTTSLKMHDNLVVGLFHPELAHFLAHAGSEPFFFSLGKTQGEAWLLPMEGALARVENLIHQAKKEIKIALFTLTHPLLTEALVQAKQRGVDVRIAIDHYTATGASAKMLKRLKAEGIPIHLSQGQQLFHHKWALIDRSTLLIGSTNWTKAAFTRNQDCFLILRHLPYSVKKKMRKIWDIIELESIN